MKKILSILLLFPVLFSLFSCAGGICSIPLGVIVYLKKPNDSSFSKDELNSFNVTTTDDSVHGYTSTSHHRVFTDEKECAYLHLQYYLGFARSKWKIKKTKASYKTRMKNFSFKIEDPSGTYKTYIMKPLDDSYKIVQAADYNKSLVISYTIKLKKSQ